MIFLKQFAVNFAVVVDHPQTALDGKVVVAENVGPLHTEQQNHLRRPNTDALQGAQFADGVLVAFLPDALRIERTAVDTLGKIGDVLRFAKGHAQRLQFGNTGSQDRLGVHGASASCIRCQIVACAFVEICWPMM